MGQLTFIVLVLIAAWVGWRTFKRERKRVSAQLREAERTANPRVTTLEKDPVTGVYRPVDKD
jgi:membrane protein implicated in regulation of membrane protease activity